MPERLQQLTDQELDAVFQALVASAQTPPSTLTGVEQPEAPLEPETLAPRLPQSWQGLPDRPSQEMVARPLMPQTAAEAEEQAAANQRYAGALNTAVQAGALAAPVGRALQVGAGLVRGAGRLLAGSPVARGVATTGAVATGLTAASGQTQQADPVTAQMGRIAAAEREQAEIRQRARERAQRLAQFREQFGDVNSSSPRARIQALQEFLASPAAGSVYGVNERGQTVRPDGVWMGRGGTSGTQRAVEAFLKAQEDARKADDTALSTLDTTLRDLNRDLRSLQSSARYAAAEANVPWWRRAVRDYAEPFGAALGFVTGVGGRMWRAASVNAADRTSVAATNALINPRGTLNARVSDLNEFFSRGGGVQPFRVSPRSQHGFTPTPGRTTGADLFQGLPRTASWTGGDTARAGAGVASIVTLEGWRYMARQELDSARAAFREDPSEVNAGRLMRAELSFGALSASARAAEMGLFSYGIASTLPRFGYRFGRPNTNAAGAEVMALDRLLRGGGGRGGPNAPGGGSSLRYPAGTRGPNGEPLGGRFRPKT